MVTAGGRAASWAGGSPSGWEWGSPTRTKTFADGEVYCRYSESIRGADLFVVQSIAGSDVKD